jgi:dolichol-phosphate mannosyltransferase
VDYEEHLGRLGANFRVELGERIEVTAGPLLARSPHVLYTNVIEALLRFQAVSRGRMLLHSACLEIGGRGLLLSARTDTGKTGTVLKMLRERGARFLSDDMTILETDGTARCFPKPLTISQHTLRALEIDDLSKAEWRKLRVQSRLHSKEGRAFGTFLAEHNLPIMGTNALTQIVVPPPKYDVRRLVACDILPEVRVTDLFIIERGEPGLSDIVQDQLLQELIENTDDAYGFPPFRYFAPALVFGEDDYVALRSKEVEILRMALKGIRGRRMVSDSFSWAHDIAALLDAPRQQRAQADEATVQELQTYLGLRHSDGQELLTVAVD